MLCSYCQEEKQLTGEHLFPKSIIDLFPESEYNLRGKDEKPFKSEHIVINDVCNKCNNENLSDLDTYGSKLVEEYFVKTYEADDNLTLNYNHSMLSRWLLKIAFNIARTKKDDIDTTWFNYNRKYILGHLTDPEAPFSIFGGLSVDMTPLPEFYFDNLKMGLYFNPLLIRDSILTFDNPVEYKFKTRESLETLKIDKLLLSVIIRFGSGMFLVFLWDKNISSTEKRTMEKLIGSLYPYVLLGSDLDEVKLERVTHAYNYHHYYIIDTNMGLGIADQTNCLLSTSIDPIQNRKDASKEWNQHVEGIRENRRIKRQKEREKRKRKKQKKNR
ncbi:hypothetical protein [Lysinibacillus sp. GbtcB16]|uniref:hypothetical protein n=1 Tax=Lysinibacillus sp. GbtcB16 TaxID=2824761 RepID=UPI001C2F8FBE|nr:hypothetical protein [Lysinibacillus sp. GbtcB16]